MALNPNDTRKPDIRRKIIAIASGKGGVGKTWFSITLAQALGQLKRRALLFDGDLGLANVDIQLGLTPKYDLSGVIAGKLTLKQAITKYTEGGFDIIAGRSGASNLSALPSSKLKALRSDLAEITNTYDRVIIDLSAGVDRTVQTLATMAGTILVVTTDEPTSLTDAYAFIKLASRANPAADIRVVVNMADSRNSGQNTYETLLNACRNFLKSEPPLAGVIRRDSQVRDSIRRQAGLLTRHPTSDAATDVESIARQFASIE